MTKNKKNIILISFISIFLLIFNIFIKNKYILFAESLYSSFMIIALFLSINMFGFQKDKQTFIKKDIFNKVLQVLIAYFIIIYISGLYFGYSKIAFSLSLKSILNNIIFPIIIYTCLELFRYVTINHHKDNKKMVILYSVIIGIMELSITTRNLYFNNIIVSYNMFADYLIPIALKQLALGYMCYYGGFKPTLLYRAAIIIYTYLIPIQPSFTKSITCIINILLPIFLLVKSKEIIDEQNEEKIVILPPQNILASKIGIAVSAFIIIVISGISPIGMTAIASDSMHPTFGKGAGVITMEVQETSLKKGDIISFNKNNKKVIHRIEKIEVENGNKKYYTKGDFNHTLDEGYVTYEDINSKVLFSIPFIGYPSLIINKIFSV